MEIPILFSYDGLFRLLEHLEALHTIVGSFQLIKKNIYQELHNIQ